ncbi:resuscitation-promoting factor [Actinomyces respiraculi]|uniref:resuscitation-promoting factor n=1 Tax=Actinomyces respiraculi TaxID=2744574 RepID=UPI001F3DC258|nr:resuscitation-promoting factor [Actinomyces respiraculi]
MTRHQNPNDTPSTPGHLPGGDSAHSAAQHRVARSGALLRAGAVSTALALAVCGGAYAAVRGTDAVLLTEAQARLGAPTDTGEDVATAAALDVSTAQVVIETVTQDVTDPHGTVEQESGSLAEGVTEVQTAGVDGVVRTTYRVVTEGGVEVSREAVLSVVVTPRTDEVVLVGTSRSASGSAETTATTTTAVNDGSVWWSLALCESGGNAGINTGNGLYGAFQFSLPTWQSLGGTGYPHENSYETQLALAQALQARSGWGQWPACAASLGLR